MKSCRVSFRDIQGIEHSVYLDAVNRFHAFGLAMDRMKKCSWCHPDYSEVQKLKIEILDKFDVSKRVYVTRDEFEQWLGNAGDAYKDKLREYISMLLGRIPPDREFKKFTNRR